MIYSRFGDLITITAARIAPVWTVKTPGKISRLYQKPPEQIRQRGKWVECKTEELPVWHYKGKYQDGTLICDGKWVDASNLIADGAWNEISAVLEFLNPEHLVKFKEWNKSTAPIETFFDPLQEDDVA